MQLLSHFEAYWPRLTANPPKLDHKQQRSSALCRSRHNISTHAPKQRKGQAPRTISCKGSESLDAHGNNKQGPAEEGGKKADEKEAKEAIDRERLAPTDQPVNFRQGSE